MRFEVNTWVAVVLFPILLLGCNGDPAYAASPTGVNLAASASSQSCNSNKNNSCTISEDPIYSFFQFENSPDQIPETGVVCVVVTKRAWNSQNQSLIEASYSCGGMTRKIFMRRVDVYGGGIADLQEAMSSAIDYFTKRQFELVSCNITSGSVSDTICVLTNTRMAR